MATRDTALPATRRYWRSGQVPDIQQRFRFVNAEILLQAGPVPPSKPLDFVCECADPGCFGVLTMPVAEYVRQTSADGRFAVKFGHEALCTETDTLLADTSLRAA